MKTLRLVATVFAMCVVAQEGHAQSPARSAPENAAEHAEALRAKAPLIRELAGMGAVDQEMRLRFLALRKDATDAERQQLDQVWSQSYEPVDRAHVARLKELLAGRAWFSRSEVGDRASGAALTIVNHSNDLAFQKEALAKIDALVPSERPNGYANLWDRIAVIEGRPQRFGTQGTDCSEGRYAAPASLENPGDLDARRKEAGLPPMSDYLASLQTLYGRCQPLRR